jgi:hypothetical protein
MPWLRGGWGAREGRFRSWPAEDLRAHLRPDGAGGLDRARPARAASMVVFRWPAPEGRREPHSFGMRGPSRGSRRRSTARVPVLREPRAESRGCAARGGCDLMPRVSVLIPSFNHEAFVGEAIESVLGQTLSDLELVIVDDGSSDGSRAVIERYTDARIVRQFQENCGRARGHQPCARALLAAERARRHPQFGRHLRSALAGGRRADLGGPSGGLLLGALDLRREGSRHAHRLAARLVRRRARALPADRRPRVEPAARQLHHDDLQRRLSARAAGSGRRRLQAAALRARLGLLPAPLRARPVRAGRAGAGLLPPARAEHHRRIHARRPAPRVRVRVDPGRRARPSPSVGGERRGAAAPRPAPRPVAAAARGGRSRAGPAHAAQCSARPSAGLPRGAPRAGAGDGAASWSRPSSIRAAATSSR